MWQKAKLLTPYMSCIIMYPIKVECFSTMKSESAPQDDITDKYFLGSKITFKKPGNFSKDVRSHRNLK